MCAVTLATAASANAETPQTADPSPAERAQEILSHSKYQTELPTLPERPTPRRPPPPPPPSEELPIGRILFYGILAAALIAILMILFQHGQERFQRFRARQQDDEGATSRLSQGDGSSLDEIEKMARAGRLAEAVHLLLQRAFELLAHRDEGQFPDSMTGREVLRGVGLKPDARQALRHLVEVVERSLFGGLPVDMRDFNQCRTCYAVLAASLATRER